MKRLKITTIALSDFL